MAEKRSGGFAKTFFGGFLGATLAVLLAVGGFALAQGGISGLIGFVKSGDFSELTGSLPQIAGPGSASGMDGYSQALTDDRSDTEGEPAPAPADGTANAESTTTIVLSTDNTSLAEVVAQKCLPSVVAIDIYVYSGSGVSRDGGYYGFLYGETPDSTPAADRELTLASLGSGVALTADGYVLTNYHVIEGFDEIHVTAEGQEYVADLVGQDPSSDLAVVKLRLPEGTSLTPMTIGDSDELKPGQWVMTIGSPFGYEQSVATGIVSALGRSTVMDDSSEIQLYVNLIQTDAAINPGNSGGAMVNATGELVGINTLITSYSGNYSGVGFAIPVNYAWAIAQQIIAGQSPTHASLGVSLVTLTKSNASRYHTAVTKGVYISRVYAGTGAEAAGLLEGDVIIAVDGKATESATDLMLAVRSHMPGDRITLTVNRDGQEMTLNATLGSDQE
ncbi:MAG: trypsin-like peptidase domain-containing protein [Eggerthellaceae bacterium]|nr:trypsin-like peptidase domain-containing protein [Eggerthellaceae bacterium]